MSAHAPIKQAAANAKNHTNDICDPVVDVGAAVEAGLCKFNGTTVYARADEDWWEPEAARIGEREGECGEGYQVHKLVAALRRWGRRLQGPEHRDGQGERHDYGEENVEVLAHLLGCIDPHCQWQVRASAGWIHGWV